MVAGDIWVQRLADGGGGWWKLRAIQAACGGESCIWLWTADYPPPLFCVFCVRVHLFHKVCASTISFVLQHTFSVCRTEKCSGTLFLVLIILSRDKTVCLGDNKPDRCFSGCLRGVESIKLRLSECLKTFWLYFNGEWPWSDVILHGNCDPIYLRTCSFFLRTSQ